MGRYDGRMMDQAVPARASVSVVLNQAAGMLLDRFEDEERWIATFRQAGLEPHFVSSEAGSLLERIRIGCRSGTQMIVVGGGDGTVACAAEIARESGCVLGILPFGTMNVLARNLGLPIGDTEAAIALLRSGRIREIDAAEVNGRLFLCASMLGLPARLARYREAGRGRGSMVRLWLRFIRAALRAFAHYGAPRWSARGEGWRVRLRAASLVVTPNPLDDKTGRVFGRSLLDAGALGFYTIRRITLRETLRLGFRLLTGHLRDDPALVERTARRVTILRIGRRWRRTIRVMNDGEVFLMTPPLRYRVVPRALKVVVPREP